MREPPSDYPEGMPERAVAINGDMNGNGSNWVVRTSLAGLAETVELRRQQAVDAEVRKHDRALLCAIAKQLELFTGASCGN